MEEQEKQEPAINFESDEVIEAKACDLSGEGGLRVLPVKGILAPVTGPES